MVTYPIHVNRSSYQGNDPKKVAQRITYNRDAKVLEDHINEQIKNGKTGTFLYSTIAHELEMSRDRVQEILFSVDCGHNGFTVKDISDERYLNMTKDFKDMSESE